MSTYFPGSVTIKSRITLQPILTVKKTQTERVNSVQLVEDFKATGPFRYRKKNKIITGFTEGCGERTSLEILVHEMLYFLRKQLNNINSR